MGNWSSKRALVRDLAKEVCIESIESIDSIEKVESYESAGSVDSEMSVEESDTSVQYAEDDDILPNYPFREKQTFARKNTKDEASSRKRSAPLRLISFFSILLLTIGTSLSLASLAHPHWLETNADILLPNIKLPLSSNALVISLRVHANMALYRACLSLNISASTTNGRDIIATINVMDVSECYDKDSGRKRRRRAVTSSAGTTRTGNINDGFVRRKRRQRRGIFAKQSSGVDVLFTMRHFIFIAICLVSASIAAIVNLFILFFVSPCCSNCICRCCKRTTSLSAAIFMSLCSSGASMVAVYIAQTGLGKNGTFLLDGMALLKSTLHRQRSNPIVQLILKSPLERSIREGWVMGPSYYMAVASTVVFFACSVMLMLYLFLVRRNRMMLIKERDLELDELDEMGSEELELDEIEESLPKIVAYYM